MRLLLLTLTVLGCTKSGSLFGGDDTAVDTAPDWWSDKYNPNGDDPPEVISGSAWCTAGSNSSGDLFFVQIQGFDPQGEDDLAATGGHVVAMDGSNEFFDEPMLTCQPDGGCEASWRSGDYGGIECKTSSDLDYYAILVDRQNNLSDRFELEWEGIKETENGGGD
jgi:hypothetical protein